MKLEGTEGSKLKETSKVAGNAVAAETEKSSAEKSSGNSIGGNGGEAVGQTLAALLAAERATADGDAVATKRGNLCNSRSLAMQGRRK